MTSINSPRHLGKSDLKISPIGLGCWQFSKRNNLAGKFWPDLDDKVIREIVQVSLDMGVNWFDTAEMYGNGASELALSGALQHAGKKPGDIIVATKWLPLFRFAANIIKTIDKRIEALNPFPIDLYQVHQPYGFSSVREEMKKMAELVKEQKIRHVGVSNFSEKQMRKAAEELDKHGLSLVSNQVRYSLLNRKIEKNGVLETAKKLGITIIAYSPLAQGILSGKFHDNPELLKNIGLRKNSASFKPEGMKKSQPVIDLLKELGVKYQVSPAQIALNWTIHVHGNTVVAIPGATKVLQAKENAGAMKFKLAEEEIQELSGIYV
ncbi:MAG: aldo/keto reductase [Bacteroidales bacterium]|nr:aldo/keto reductase [Bacteroidota bacterium]MBL6949363.1 aldo/keto reductase [Bacteroidales bacterium]